MKINEIYTSIDGEVNHWGQGTLSTFIRLSGCNLSCKYCDTKQARDPHSGKEMSITQIVKTIKQIGCPKLTITGGEPLLQNEDLAVLLVKLFEDKKIKFKVSIETNGTFPIIYSPQKWKQLSWVVDYKLHYPEKMDKQNFLYLRPVDWVKIVIGNIEDDYDAAIYIMKDLKKQGCLARFAFSPVNASFKQFPFLSTLPILLNERLVQDKHWDVVINYQIHKYLEMK